MLIYKNDGTLYCISKKALKLAGYNDVAEFLDDHADYSELFVKKPGFIYNFENFSWLSFLRHANPDQKKVLIATRDHATYESELEMEIVYPVEFGENTPEFFYQINFKNLHLANGAAEAPAAFGNFSEERMVATIDLDRELIDREYEAFEGGGAAVSEPTEEAAPLFGEPSPEPSAAPEPEPIVFGAPQIEESAEKTEETPLFETPAKEAETPRPAPRSPADEEALDLVDFTFDEAPESRESAGGESPKEEEKKVTSYGEDALENAFAELGSAFAPQAPEAVPAEEKEASAENPEPSIFEKSPEPADTLTAPKEPAEKEPAETAPSLSYEMPDLRKAAATLGLPETMVKAFVKEFVDTYFEDIHEVKMAMASNHIAVVKKEAMKLKGIAANLLMEPMVESLESVLTAKKEAEVRSLWEGIDGYVHALAEAYSPESLRPAEPAPMPLKIVSEESPSEKTITKTAEESGETGARPGTIIPVLEEAGAGETIEFDPNEAANALGLPESLIIEFVNDFVTQAREEKRTFLDGFEKGDLKTVNEVAHKLKGVAANLRIEDMRALMEEAQHADSLEAAKGPVERFYRKLGALSNTMAKEFA